MFRRMITTWPGRVMLSTLVAVLVGGPILVGRVMAAPAAPEIRTAGVSRGTVTQAVAVSGSVSASGTARLNFQTSGRVAEILVAVGERVLAGQVLARLDQSLLAIAVSQAQANLASADARYQQTLAGATAEDVAAARLSVENSQRSLDQSRRTSDTDRIAAGQALAKTENNYTTARSNFIALGSQARAEAELFSRAVADLPSQQAGILTIAYALSNTADARSAQTALGGATSPLATAASAASSILKDALVEHASASAALVAATLTFDSTLAAGGDTAGPISGYQSAALAYSLATTKLTSAIDLVNGQLTGPLGSISSALTTLNSSSARLLNEFDSLREGLRFLTDRVIAAQQPAGTAKARLTQAATAQATVSDAVAVGMVNGKQALAIATDRGTNSVSNAEGALAATQASFAKTTASPKAADIASAYASVLSSQAALETATNNLANSTLRSPTAGVVAAMSGQVGESAAGSATNPFITIANVTTLAVHGTIGEADVAKLKNGQVATVIVDAVGTTTRMTGKVTLIDPVATIQQGVPVYGVDVTIDVPQTQVRPGMSATASVILASRTNVLTVPNLAVRTVAGRRGVQVLRDGKVVDAQVELGVANESVTEVIGGLAEGDLVVLPQPRTTTTTTAPGAGGRLPNIPIR